MKIDPYKHKEKYLNWKEKVKEGIPSMNKENSEIIIQYLEDMEKGINISNASQKGSRGYPRLNNLRNRLMFFAREFEKVLKINKITSVNEDQIFEFFNLMRNGTICRVDGGQYLSTADFVKDFKAFWHWHIKVSKKKGIIIQNIATDLDTSKAKPKWVYLTEEQIKELCNGAKFKYRVLIMFLFDTGIRSPTELVNIRVSDLYDDCKEVHIREEISKTFGRRIKLMLSSQLLKDYIKANSLGYSDQLFNINPQSANKYLQRLAKRILGDAISPAGKKYTELTMYHFRHCACCYWLPRYKSESALKYRFGWKKSDKIHYYSELLGMKDTISEEDLLVDVTKTEIEKRLIKFENANHVLVEDNKQMKFQMQKISELVMQMSSQRGGLHNNQL